jgi:hypothetical protein
MTKGFKDTSRRLWCHDWMLVEDDNTESALKTTGLTPSLTGVPIARRAQRSPTGGGISLAGTWGDSGRAKILRYIARISPTAHTRRSSR